MIKVIGLNTKVLKKEPFSGSPIMACASSCVQKMTFCTYGCIRTMVLLNRLLMM